MFNFILHYIWNSAEIKIFWENLLTSNLYTGNYLYIFIFL